MWTAGPWKTVRATAVKAGWTVTGFLARGYAFGVASPSDGLVDTVSLRCRRGVQRAVAVWERRTWPVLGRGRKDDDGRTGEGRTSTAGKTWLWHPPLVPPDEALPVPAWKFGHGWVWLTGGILTKASSSEVRDWMKGVPGT